MSSAKYANVQEKLAARNTVLPTKRYTPLLMTLPTTSKLLSQAVDF
jgi:hypothetical protein